MSNWELLGVGIFIGIFIGIWIAWLLAIWGNRKIKKRKKYPYGARTIYKSWRFGK